LFANAIFATDDGSIENVPGAEMVATTFDEPLLSVSGLAKSFGATCALRGADLCVQAGQVHALMGENGAGKSTLVKMLVGALRPDAGTIALRGRKLAFSSVRDAIAAGIMPVYQHATVFAQLSVEENLRAFDIAGSSPLRRTGKHIPLARLLRVAARIGLNVDPRQTVARLSMAERQLLEIARGVAHECSVLILDEPTAALNEHETEQLFSAIDGLRADGLGIVFISHKLGEITRMCDAVTVLRDGRTVLASAPIASLTHQQIVEAMVGPVADRPLPELPAVGATRMVIAAAGCRNHFQNLSLNIGAGEIVGFVGLMGAGATEVGEALGGSRPLTEGTINIDGGATLHGSRTRFRQAGVGFVPADRSADGVLPGLSCATNAAASTFASIARKAFINDAMEVAACAPLFELLKVRPADPRLPIDALSGGNQQKVMIVRNLLLPALKVLVLIEPTRGVDVMARAAIHDAVVDAARRGVAVVIVSSDTDEVVALSHRIVVMRNGQPADILMRGTALEDVIARVADASSPSSRKALNPGNDHVTV
jgi:ABC-type sugar transport system ATPase subunit